MIKRMGSFRSYVGLEEYEMKAPRTPDANLQPDFLRGELVISEAESVLKFTVSKRKGISGSLFVTNARLVFVSMTSDNRKVEDSVPLLSINTLWYYEHTKGAAGPKKHRHTVRLGPNYTSLHHHPSVIPSGSTRVHEVLISCSTFKTFRFSFKFSPLDHGLKVCNSIIHHAFPSQLERLFYFDYSKVSSVSWRQALSQSAVNVPSYLEKGDWLKELNISRNTTGFRISTANEGFHLCGSLPEWIVVPADLIDVKLISLSEKLRGNRPPHWSWANAKGGCILRMSKLNNYESDSSAENAFFELLRKTHQQKRPPEIVDLDKEMTPKDIRHSFSKLIEFCCPESSTEIQELDSKFLSLLEQTKWMGLISKVLHLTEACTEGIVDKQDLLILQENESRDTACLYSSLIQIVLDPRFRTTVGFFTLIQKEWIAFGHPFHSTYKHASPIFLLFLDCVHQLMLQNPVEFEFNEKLLMQTWESCFDSTKGTFLFDTPQQRRELDRWNENTAWSTILVDRDSVQDPRTRIPSAFVNPWYKLKPVISPPKFSLDKALCNTLKCSGSMPHLQFWTYHYHRQFLSTQFSLGLSDIVGYNIDNSTPSPATPSPSVEQTFTYSPETSVAQSSPLGRDVAVELRVIDRLLGALSTSTRYTRNNSSNVRATQSPSRPHDKYVSKPSTSTGGPSPYLMDGKRRKHPFTHL